MIVNLILSDDKLIFSEEIHMHKFYNIYIQRKHIFQKILGKINVSCVVVTHTQSLVYAVERNKCKHKTLYDMWTLV